MLHPTSSLMNLKHTGRGEGYDCYMKRIPRRRAAGQYL